MYALMTIAAVWVMIYIFHQVRDAERMPHVPTPHKRSSNSMGIPGWNIIVILVVITFAAFVAFMAVSVG